MKGSGRDLAVDCETMAAVPFARLRRAGGRLAPPGPDWDRVNVGSVSWCLVEAGGGGAVGEPQTRFVRPEAGETVDNPFSPEVTVERLREEGRPAAAALRELGEAALAADRLVSHNAEFDRGVILSHMRRAGLAALADAVAAKEWLCTMRRAAGGRKFPKLGELMTMYGLSWPDGRGEPHTSAADTVACAECHLRLLDAGL